VWPYWLLLLLPASAALLGARPRSTSADGSGRRRWGLEWHLAAAVATLMVGFRHEVGGDWFDYIGILERVRGAQFLEVLRMPELGYMVLNWVSVQFGWGIYGVNLICGAVFSVGLIRFCRSQPRPWLALAVAVPYLVIVVGMGYSRQGVALGLVMLGLLALRRNSAPWFVAWVLLGATFHRTAVLLLPVAALANSRNRYWTLLWVGLALAGAYQLFLQDSVAALRANYLEARYQSEGALIRLAMNAVPAAVVLSWWRWFRFAPTEGSLWRWFAIVSLLLLGALFLSPSSTAVDRIALYMLPLQLVVFSRLPDVLGARTGRNQLGVLVVVLYCAIVQFVWLNFASHAEYWLPYRFYLLEAIT